MERATSIVERIVEWASHDESVRALLLVGSRGRNEAVDELSDFDIAVFTTTLVPHTSEDLWLHRIGEVWVCIPEEFDRDGEAVPTRLVIFDGGVKVDFAFYRLGVLERFDEGDELRGGFEVLVDKEGTTRNLRSPNGSAFKHREPTEAEFVHHVSEFWFECYYVAKYLRRGELWLAKTIDGNLKAFLLKAIEWNEQARHGRDYETHYSGKEMKAWVSPATWERLHATFAHFDGIDSWESLFATMQLFRDLARETAELLSFSYPENVDRNMSTFVIQINESIKS